MICLHADSVLQHTLLFVQGTVFLEVVVEILSIGDVLMKGKGSAVDVYVYVHSYRTRCLLVITPRTS